MFLSDLSISRPVAMVMITVALVVFGLIAYNKLAVENMPDTDFPFVIVTTSYLGADPATIESEVTELIEDEVATVSGIKNLTSTSYENVSLVFMEFEMEVDVNIATQDVRDKLEGIERSLPDNCDSPVVRKYDPTEEPILEIAVGGDAPPQEMSRFIEDFIKPRVESIEGVGSVEVTGNRDREIRIWLNPDRMTAYEVSVQQIVGAIQVGHVEIPGGRIETGEREYLVVTAGELESVDAFNDLVITRRGDSLIRLSDVALVEDGLENQRSLARINGLPAISLAVIKKSGSNTIAVADAVYEIVEELKAESPPGLQFSIPRDDSVFVRDSFDQVQEHMFGGGLLAVLVVLLFLGSFRTTIIAAISIPTSIIATYLCINFLGFTLNNITMMALTLMVGILIDDAVVVLENIYRHLEMGKTPIQAAKEGAREIGFAVLSSTLVIVAVFIPVANMTGLVGRFMYQYGITVAVGVSISYLIAITLSPMLASRFMQKGTVKFFLFDWFNKGFRYLESGYRWLIGAALRRKGITVLIAFVSMVGALFLFMNTPQDFFGTMDRGSISISIEMPQGTSLHALDEFVKPIEDIALTIPEVENVLVSLGGGFFGEQNSGSLYLDLVDKQDRNRSDAEISDELRERLAGFSGAKIVVGSSTFFGAYSFNFDILGNDIDELEAISSRILDAISADPLFKEWDTSIDKGKPEVHIEIDRDRAADLGVNIATLGSTLNLLVSGEQSIGDFMEAGRQSEIKVRLEGSFRDRPEDLANLVVYNRDSDPVEISSFADITVMAGPSQIDHVDKMRSVTISANVADDRTLGDAVDWLDENIDGFLSPDVRYKISGEADIMTESFAAMGNALLLAVLLIYIVLAAQFNHFIHPLTIMISLPLSFVGAFGFLYLSGMPMTMFALIGIVMLMGLVAKNAILVVEFTNQLRERGMERDEALLTAGPVRLRPVLMTALSTISGMLPVALMIGHGSGVEMRAPMAVAMVGGLTASTLLTLVVIPVIYALFDQATVWLLKRLGIKTQEETLTTEIPHDQVK